MRIYASLVIVVALLLLVGQSLGDRTDLAVDPIDEILNNLSLEQKIGQLFMVGFAGTTPSEKLRHFIEDLHIGGFILFERNIKASEQVASLTRKMQSLAKSAGHPGLLLISTDQEGGIVSRLPMEYPFPSFMALGATRDADLTRQYGRVIGIKLLSLGINVNMAPVLDVNNNPKNPVIGVRSLGEDPNLVADLGTAYAQGLAESGVIAVGKHFPGHGDTHLDSHYALPLIPYERERLDRIELFPFQLAVEQGIDAIMTAHIIFSAIDPDLPATLSSPVLGLLRDDFAFSGLIFTDALEMDALARFTPEKIGVLALMGGVDQLLIAWPSDPDLFDQIYQGVLQAARSGEISEERLNRSLRRILQAKLEYAAKWETKTTADLDAEQEIAREIAEKSVTLVANENNLIPLSAGQSAYLLMPELSVLAEVDALLEDPSIKPLIMDYASYPVNPTQQQRQALLADIPTDAVVVVGVYRAKRYPNQRQLVQEVLDSFANPIVVSLREPYDLAYFDQTQTQIAAYGATTSQLRAVIEVIYGNLQPSGTLPVTIKKNQP